MSTPYPCGNFTQPRTFETYLLCIVITLRYQVGNSENSVWRVSWILAMRLTSLLAVMALLTGLTLAKSTTVVANERWEALSQAANEVLSKAHLVDKTQPRPHNGASPTLDGPTSIGVVHANLTEFSPVFASFDKLRARTNSNRMELDVIPLGSRLYHDFVVREFSPPIRHHLFFTLFTFINCCWCCQSPTSCP